MKRPTYKDRLKFCFLCPEIYNDEIDGYVCSMTRQPVFMMEGCAMDPWVRTDLDPAFVWFPSAAYAEHFCEHARYGKPCQFKNGKNCHVSWDVKGPIKELTHCPLLRFDRNGKRLQPADVYPLYRDSIHPDQNR